MSIIDALKTTFLTLCIIGITACGGSSGSTSTNGTTVSGVSLPASVSVIKPQTLTPAQLLAGVSVARDMFASGRLKPLAVNVPATSDFSTDDSFTLVDIIGQDQLDSINGLYMFFKSNGCRCGVEANPQWR